MIRKLIPLAVLALAFGFGAISDVPGQYVRDARYYNPYTGAAGAAREGYNPYTGTRGAEATAYNPYTGRDTTEKQVYNPYTGRSAEVARTYNPYTGRSAYGYAYRR